MALVESDANKSGGGRQQQQSGAGGGGGAQEFACWHCDTSLYGHRFVNREGHPYCVNCYNELFANHCEECQQIISVDNKDLAFKEKHWHDMCFKCSQCKVSLVSETFGAKEDKLFCGDCWDLNFAPKCSKCNNPFKAGSMKLSWNGGEWHKDCFACTNCDKVIGQEAFHPQDGQPYCEGCWEQLFAIKCTKCTEPIKAGGVTYRLEPYHRECFVCFECGVSLAGQRFTLKDENPICAECFANHYAHKCFHCSEPITGIGGNRYIIFEKSQWHCQCFNCRQCGSSLVGVNFVAEGYGDELEIYCQPCGFQKRGWETQHTSQAQQAEVPQMRHESLGPPARSVSGAGGGASTTTAGGVGVGASKKEAAPAPQPKTSTGSKFGRKF
ncbi:four and a half LIM domains protein 2-like [Symsagittifera roscoffensis]|uniref:four and a half LIM domains protein 2-like n=1 Tax=Symsagittifera roscoffensis TaxID=84072 RepID=UPI00307CB8C8